MKGSISGKIGFSALLNNCLLICLEWRGINKTIIRHKRQNKT